MLTEERKQFILEQLLLQEIVNSQQLTLALHVSESTIRRDLRELEDAGMLIRIHGGAKKVHALSYEQSIQEKSAKNRQSKQKIAEFAASFINDGDIIYLDAGTSTFEMLPYLKEKTISVVTNSVYHAFHLSELQIPTIVIGGSVKLSTKAIWGQMALEQLARFRFNFAFMGMNGVHSKYGFTTPDPEEAAMKEHAMNQAERCFVLVDASKFGEVSFTKVAELVKASILTDFCPKEYRTSIQEQTKIKEVH